MKVAVFGSSGCAREAVDICEAAGCASALLIDRKTGTDAISGLQIVCEDAVDRLALDGYGFSIGIGDNRLRRRIYEKFPTLPFVNLVHPSVTFGRGQRRSFDEKKGNIAAAGVRFTNNIVFGNFGCFNLNCTVSHDVILGDFINISPGASVTGNIHLAEGVFIGAGATIINGRAIEDKLWIGAHAVVGAGAVVIGDVPDGKTAIGVPAKLK